MKSQVWGQRSRRVAERASVGIVTESGGGVVGDMFEWSCSFERYLMTQARALPYTRTPHLKVEWKTVRLATRTLQIGAGNCTSVRFLQQGKLRLLSTYRRRQFVWQCASCHTRHGAAWMNHRTRSDGHRFAAVVRRSPCACRVLSIE